MNRKAFAFAFLWGVFLWEGTAGAAERPLIIPVDIQGFPRTVEESEGLKEFFKQRIKWAFGFEEAFDSNVFLRDNDPQEDYISALEGQFFFVDPRGTILYGLTHEINAFRYHRKDVNAIDHDFAVFLDVDPGGRYRFRSNYRLLTANSLLLGPEAIDILRRNADFQRRVEHIVNGRFSYLLTETNAVVPQMEYSLYDDQAIADSDTDRRIFKAILDLDHDWRPDWTLYGGYEFNDVTFPARKQKGSESHAARLGIRHDLTEISQLDLLLKFEDRQWETGQGSSNFSYTGNWAYQFGPRTGLSASYTDERVPSFSETRLQFRSIRPSLDVTYELTPLTKIHLGTGYEKQRSGGKDVLTGNPATTATTSRYTLRAGADWQIREKAKVTLDYSFSRSKTDDYTSHIWRLGFETEL